MRRLALSLLVAATGCNWVFGLQKTQPVDAAPDTPDGPPDAPFLRVILEHQVGTTDTSGAPIAGMPIAISPAPTIQLGAMGAMLSPADYDAATRTVIVPFDLPGNPWRLVYTTADDLVPTEIQWTVNTAHLTLPWLERAGDSPPPAGSGWNFQPQAATPPVIGAPRVLTSGAFTSTVVPISDLGVGDHSVAFPFASQAQGLLSPLGTPTVAKGDWALLYDYRFISGTDPTLHGSVGYSWVQSDLSAGSLATVMPMWVTSTTTISGINWADAVNGTRLNTVSSLNGTCCSFHLEYGILPSPFVAPFLPSASGVDQTSMVDLFVYDSPSTEPLSITPVNDPPTTQVALPRMILAAYQAPRTTNGVTLTNTIQTLGTAKTLAFAAPLATAVQFGTQTLMTGSVDNLSVPGSASTISLRWTPESGGNLMLTADDYVVTLYEIANSTLTPIRRYQVLTPRVEVDGTLLASGHRYVFGITSRAGFPNAANADYSTVTLPFSETTTFPMAFVIQ